MDSFRVEGGQFLMNGKPYTVISGAMHYFRVPRQCWYDRLLKLKECGFNTVETYTCWNLHEPNEGTFDFSGMLDIDAYISCAEALGLNVIVRPGPYICAEWDMGGLPAWLLREPALPLRCHDERFIEKVRHYYDRLLPIVKAHLLSNGGRVIMMQIENEYGSFGDDHDYMRRVAEIYQEHGIDCLLYTSDGTELSMLSGGTLPEYLCVANFGSRPRENFDALTRFRPGQPKMCGEYWVGWFDHWYGCHHVRDPREVASLVREMLDEGASLNFYMFHGGTNFGFMNGANDYGTYEPTVTSYDYCALLSEAGDRTPAYYEVKRVIEKKTGRRIPLTASESEKRAYGAVRLDQICTLFDSLEAFAPAVFAPECAYMEDLGQYYGYMLYSTTLEGPLEEKPLEADFLHDRAVVFLDGRFAGIRERSRRQDEIRISLAAGESVRLDILCENMGRVNYGPNIRDRKGIRGVRTGLRYHFGWQMTPIRLDRLAALRWSELTNAQSRACAFLRGTLRVDGAPCDTFLRTDGFHKGIAIVNGFNLGRYYNDAGPQRTLFVPAEILHSGENEVIIFETDGFDRCEVCFTDTPDLGPTK